MEKKFLAVLVAVLTLTGVVAFKDQNVNVNVPEFTAGAVSSLDSVDNGNVSIAGVKTLYVSNPLVATSSTICSMRNTQGTSSVASISVAIKSGILGANNYSISTSTNSYATSSVVFVLDNVVATGAQDYLSWYPNGTTTSVRTWGAASPATNGELNYFIAPGEYLNVRLATTTGAGPLAAYYQGTCSAEFRQI